jgi:hypothetical protein
LHKIYLNKEICLHKVDFFMKILTKIILLSLCIANLHAELLIIKKAESGFAPLDATDEFNYPAIGQILLNYQWPMVIANQTLTESEKDELFAQTPNAEENFIRKKIQDINPAYDVAFIPTCLYEMFVINITDQKGNNPLQSLLKTFDMGTRKINIMNEINGNGPHHNPWQDVYDTFAQRNNLFYTHAFFFCNNVIVQNLFMQYPILQTPLHGIALSDAIQSIIETMSYNLALNIFNRNTLYNSYQIFYKHSSGPNETISYHQAIAQVINLEYEMRRLNKGLLLRGTHEIELSRLHSNKLPIFGSTLTETEIIQSLQKSYKQKSTLPYSVSFGNSLFGGFFYDDTACVAYYFTNVSAHGYGISINKNQYIKNRTSSLFFISPLAPLAALFASGEFFHSRTKTSISQNIDKNKKIIGLAAPTSEIIDSEHIITTLNDPLVNAELFSDYLAENMYILSVGHSEIYSVHPSHLKNHQILPEGFTPAEIDIFNQKMKIKSEILKANQRKAADYYKATRKLAQHLPKATENYRQYLDDTKAFNQEMQQLEEKHGPMGPEWLD